MSRKEFEMTDEQLDKLLAACKPSPYIVVGGREPESLQARVNAAWSQLGSELGFESTTVKPVPGKSDMFFTAEVFGE